MLSASRDERRRKGKPREEDGEQWLPVQFQDRIRRKAGGGGEEAQPLLAPDEIGGLAEHVGAA